MARSTTVPNAGDRYSRLARRIAVANASGVCSLTSTAVPVRVRQKVIGVINVESEAVGAFSESDLRFLSTLSGQVSAAIERARLYQAQQDYTAQLAGEVGQRTAELQAERDRMQAILDSAGEGIFFADRQGTIQYVNAAFGATTGYSSAEALGRKPNILKSGAQSAET